MDLAPVPSTLLESQFTAGAWGHRKQNPSTELTALCVLALRACGDASGAIAAGRDWLRSAQRSDGGWAPYPGVDQSTWLTAPAVLALGPGDSAAQAGVSWIAGQRGRESTFIFRLRTWLLGGTQIVDDGVAGWPWFPGAAAWVTPTSFSLLALAAIQRADSGADLTERIEAGRRYLLDRICHDGGWNHGSARALGYESASYPETTGLALLALHGHNSPEVERGIAAARTHWKKCRTVNGLAWLTMGLHAHGDSVPLDPFQAAPCRDLTDVAVSLLASAAADGRNVLLD